MLEVSGIALSYTREILAGVSFNVKKGQIAGIVGPSGSGKSSLLKIIGGLLGPDAGNVSWKGERIKGPSERLIPGHPEIQLVNQDFALDLFHTTEQNIVQKMLYLPNDTRAAFASELLRLVGLEELKDEKAVVLSGGEQQRLAIARALAAEPEVLLLDEPFSHLDAHLREKIGNYLRELARVRQLTCILVSHEGQDVLQWCEEIHFVWNGRIARSASPPDFYFRPSSAAEAQFFGDINEVVRNGRAVLFRPVEYEIDNETPEIEVQFVDATFAGIFWRNLACTARGEMIVLLAQEPLKNVRGINIRKKYPQADLAGIR
jgi:iron(III) transport system ATP-binding protein